MPRKNRSPVRRRPAPPRRLVGQPKRQLIIEALERAWPLTRYLQRSALKIWRRCRNAIEPAVAIGQCLR